MLNLEGIFTRYEDADEQLERIAALPKEVATREMQDIYSRADQARADRPADRGDQGAEGRRGRVADARSACCKYHEIAIEAGLDVLVIQGTVVSGEHVSTVSEPLNLKEFIPTLDVPVVVGGCASYHTGPAPDAHRRRGRARRRRARARPARRAACSASACRRRPRSRTSRTRARRTCWRPASTAR